MAIQQCLAQQFQYLQFISIYFVCGFQVLWANVLTVNVLCASEHNLSPIYFTV